MYSLSLIRIKSVLWTGVAILAGNVSLAQNLLPGAPMPDYKPMGALVFRPAEAASDDGQAHAVTHAAYMFYISQLQNVLLRNDPEAIAQQAEQLGISAEDVERLYTLLNEFNTRSASARRTMLEEECKSVRTGQVSTNLQAQEVAARINSDEARDRILQEVLAETGVAFDDEVVGRVKLRVAEISASPQFAKLQLVKATVDSQGIDYQAYVTEQCAAP